MGAYGNHWLGASVPVVTPPPEVKGDLEIVQLLAAEIDRRTGAGADDGRTAIAPKVAGSARDWKRRLLRRVAPMGVTVERLERESVRNPLAGNLLFEGAKFPTPSGKMRLLTAVPPPPEDEPGFPLWLFSSSTEKAQCSQWAGPAPTVLEATCHPDAAPGLGDGADVLLESAIGSLRARLKLDPLQRRDVVDRPEGGALRLRHVCQRPREGPPDRRRRRGRLPRLPREDPPGMTETTGPVSATTRPAPRRPPRRAPRPRVRRRGRGARPRGDARPRRDRARLLRPHDLRPRPLHGQRLHLLGGLGARPPPPPPAPRPVAPDGRTRRGRVRSGRHRAARGARGVGPFGPRPPLAGDPRPRRPPDPARPGRARPTPTSTSASPPSRARPGPPAPTRPSRSAWRGSRSRRPPGEWKSRAPVARSRRPPGSSGRRSDPRRGYIILSDPLSTAASISSAFS